MKHSFYWDQTSECVGGVLTSHLSPEMNICEIGFAGGHFLEWLEKLGYKHLTGIEIREDQYHKTKQKFQNQGLNIHLILGDILDLNDHFDAIYSTGLLQCLDQTSREKLLIHLSELADVAVFTVPEIQNNRNIDSDVAVGVAGCKEYSTGNIPYELSQVYGSVRVGRLDKSKLKNEDTYLYYICRR